MENAEKQFLDAEGLGMFADAIRSGDLRAGKAAEAEKAAWEGLTGKPESFPPSEHTHEASDIGIAAIPEATIEAIISGTYNPDNA